jgi:hypothetical protein
MQNRCKDALGFAAIATAIVFLHGVLAWQSQQLPQNYRTEPSKSENRNGPLGEAVSNHVAKEGGEKGGKEEGWYRELLKPSDWLLVLFTGVLAIYTRRLYVATAAIVESDRPHMLPETMKAWGVTSPPDQNGMVKMFLEYRSSNYGRSPAFLRSTSVMMNIVTVLPNTPDYGAIEPIRFIVAVNGGYGSLKPGEALADATLVKQLLMGEKELFVWTFLEYTGAERSTMNRASTYKTRAAFQMIFEGGDASARAHPAGPDSYWENS